MFSGLSVESKGEGIVVSAVEEGRLAHVQGKPNYYVQAVKTGWKLSFYSTYHWVSEFKKCSKKSTICNRPRRFDTYLDMYGGSQLTVA